MKKNNNVSTGLGTVPDLLDRLGYYSSEKQRLKKRLKARKENATQSLKVSKKNNVVVNLNEKLKKI